MSTDEFDDIPLAPEEQLDSDEVRNDDGDEVVDPPERWIEAKEDETLDERLAEEVPDVTPDEHRSARRRRRRTGRRIDVRRRARPP